MMVPFRFRGRCSVIGLIWLTVLLCYIWRVTEEVKFAPEQDNPEVFNKGFEKWPLVLPRRSHMYSMKRSSLFLSSPPSWISCPCSNSSSSIWTMATTSEYVRSAVLLGWSIRSLWNMSNNGPLPDFRVIVLHPDPLPALWPTLEKAGWGICHLPRITPRKGQENHRVKDGYSKLHVWNMTDYQQLLFLDSDLLIVKDIGPIMKMAEVLIQPASSKPGPRIVAGLERKEECFNTGVFIIRPDREEYMWLINLYYMGKVPVSELKLVEQSFLNHYYNTKEEKIFLGLHLHAPISTQIYSPELWKEYENNFTIMHFNGHSKPWKPNCKYKIECEKWLDMEKKMIATIKI